MRCAVALVLAVLPFVPVAPAGASPVSSRPKLTPHVRGAVASASLARATIVVDVGSGEVLQAANDRQPLRVASLAKILTALVVRRHVPLGSPVPISARAASMPAIKINAKEGQVWNATDLLWCLLLPSANDAAVALAEKAGDGTLTGFEAELDREAARLHLDDHPVLHDPAGLDGPLSFQGGNELSARDLAIATRAFLADPVLAGIVRHTEYRFHGGDGLDHRVIAHNGFVHTYPGAIGVKTGYTEASGHSLVAAAQRSGRTLLAVVIDSPDPDAVATALLDQAFDGSLAAPADADELPPVPVKAATPSTTATAPSRPVVAAAAAAPVRGGSTDPAWLAAIVAAGLLCLTLAFLSRRVAVLHRRGLRRLTGPSRRRHPTARAHPWRRAGR